MPGYDGSGVYTLNFTFATEAASPPIAISKLDTEFAGIAAALSLCILRNGNGKPTADIDWNAKKITNLANAAADGDALNRVTADGRYARVGSNETVTGTWTFSGLATLSNAFPVLQMLDTDLTETTGKRWYIGTANNVFFVYRNTAAGGDFSTYDTILAANGSTFNYMGYTVWHSGNDGSGSGLDADTVDGVQAASLVQTSAVESGTFTIYLRASHNGANITSATAYWKKFNGVASLFIPQLTTTNTTAALYVENLPAAIQPATSQVFVASGYDAGAVVPINAQIISDYVLLSLTNSGGFTTSATTKGISAITLTYIV